LGLKEDILFLKYFIFIFGGCSEAAMGELGAQRPVRRGNGNAPKKTGARSARARTRGQNPLVGYSLVFLSSHTEAFFYSHSF
jgi:hypothetical protein